MGVAALEDMRAPQLTTALSAHKSIFYLTDSSGAEYVLAIGSGITRDQGHEADAIQTTLFQTFLAGSSDIIAPTQQPVLVNNDTHSGSNFSLNLSAPCLAADQCNVVKILDTEGNGYIVKTG